MKKILLAVAIVGIIGLSNLESKAAATWYTCNINMTGNAFGYVYVNLTDAAATPIFTDKWMLASTDATQANRYLATALTAISSGMQVLVYADTAVAGYPQIQALYIIP